MPLTSLTGIDPLSLCTLKLTPTFQGRELSTATGFCIGDNEQRYVVTNWHVVTGRNPDTNVCLDENLAIPTSLKIPFHRQGVPGEWVTFEYQLYDEEGNHQWLEHELGCEVDVVLLPLPNVPETSFYPIHDALSPNAAGILAPAYTVSVVGYPLGLHIGGNWPIWKTGHIASDPVLDFLGKPIMLIDATTRGGMSGSPVVIRTRGPYQMSNGDVVAMGPQFVTSFVGVYSGRTAANSEIGRVWKPKVVHEVIARHSSR